MPKRPNDASERPATIAEALERAQLALQAQRLEEAERLAGGVLAADRGNVEAGRILGIALLLQDRASEAIAPLQRAARRSEDPVIETLLARALSTTGAVEDALELLRRAAARRPALPQAFLELGDQLGALGRFDEAAAAFEAGLALAPDAAVLRVGLGYLSLKRNDRRRARALFAEVRAVAPERYDALIGLAHVMAADGDYAAAVELYRPALAARPGDAAIRIELGKGLLELGQREAGEAALRTAVDGAAAWAAPAIQALAATPLGRFFQRPSAAAAFLGVRGS